MAGMSGGHLLRYGECGRIATVGGGDWGGGDEKMAGRLAGWPAFLTNCECCVNFGEEAVCFSWIRQINLSIVRR
jgi:hypothetical protein